ncbi:hypothetical protein DSO57_1004894 [Entomophthora muscae]|uniref:Uncharacterized protein n=1 Tax=Entomophthora muscae TaxID=34485 RepID=A0ACC2TVW9_9FUNG|nr:hypothetical protein DSO57_1004894 [Entomophthora muscae]
MFFQSLFIALVYCQARCRKIHDRVEIRDMQASDRLAYFDAIKALAANRTQGQSEYDRIVKIHVLNARNIHMTPLFLPWHRHYLYHFQMKLFELNSSIVIPYWDTGMDSQKPEESEIFTRDFYGGTGNEILDHCLANGQFTGMRVTVEDQQPNGTFRRCIRRQFDGKTKISPFFSSDTISPIIRNNNFTEFTSQIETGPHAPPHNNIGGQRGHMGRMSSPNDPIFWIHHANVDYWYAQWQDSFGKDNYIPGKENDPLPHFSPTTVKDTFDTLAYPYCYRYVPKIVPPVNPSPEQTPSDQGQPQPNNPSTSQNIQPIVTQLVITDLHRRQNTPALGSNPDQLLLALKEACPANVCPDAFDRNDLRRLRVPKPTPLRWILMNNLDLVEVRRQEIANAMLIFALNRNENYQSKDSIGMWSYYHYTSSSSRTSSQSNRTSRSRQVTRTILSNTG